MSVNEVLPTGKCFDDALDLLNDILKYNPECVADLRLIHGICTAPDGHHYAHAWVEDLATERALFVGLVNGERMNLAASREEYWTEVGMVERTPYTYRQAVIENRRHNHYGPWLDHYRRLCKER